MHSDICMKHRFVKSFYFKQLHNIGCIIKSCIWFKPPISQQPHNGCQPTSTRFMKSCNTLGIKQVEDALNVWVDRYNQTYLHSSLGYKTPEWVEKNFNDQEVA